MLINTEPCHEKMVGILPQRFSYFSHPECRVKHTTFQVKTSGLQLATGILLLVADTNFCMMIAGTCNDFTPEYLWSHSDTGELSQ